MNHSTPTDEFTMFPARYAKGKVIIRAPGRDGYKTRAARLAGDGLGLQYVGRSNGYTASPSQAERFKRLFNAGFDASWATGTVEHTEKGLRGLSWREADRMARDMHNRRPTAT